MQRIDDGLVGNRVVLFGVRYFLRGTLEATCLDDMGCMWFELGDATTQGPDCNESGPTKDLPFGAIRIPQTAIGLGIQLESAKGWAPPASARRRKIAKDS